MNTWLLIWWQYGGNNTFGVFLISKFSYFTEFFSSYFCNPAVLALVATPYFMTTDTFYWGRPAAGQTLAGTPICWLEISKSVGEKYTQLVCTNMGWANLRNTFLRGRPAAGQTLVMVCTNMAWAKSYQPLSSLTLENCNNAMLNSVLLHVLECLNEWSSKKCTVVAAWE